MLQLFMHYWLIKAAVNGYLVFKLYMCVPFIDDVAVSDTTASKCSIHGFKSTVRVV